MADTPNVPPKDRLSDERRQEYLQEHIPYRVVAVEGFGWFLEKLQSGDRLVDLSLNIAGRILNLPALTFTNPLVDAGLAHGRALCEFLGFRRDRKDALVPVAGQGRGDDFRIEDLGLKRVSPESACQVGPQDPVEIQQALIYFLRVASKGVAHVTIEAPATDRVRLWLATNVIPRLVRQQVYQSLGLGRILDRRHHPCPVAEAIGALNLTRNRNPERT